jgi:dinuclear metal center YbgI/SA1388 family protein
MSTLVVADIERALGRAFPHEWAEEWDRVGLLAGNPEREVTGVTVALDPSLATIESAIANGDNVVVTHHPAFLEPARCLTPGPGPAGVLYAALDSSIALLNAHTNLDRAPRAGTLLPDALGLSPIKPIERALQPMTLITVFAPAAHSDRIAAVMSAAGAGRMGDYHGASFTSAPGTGMFVADASASPFTGQAGGASSVSEVRIEMVAARSNAQAVVGAARGAHPYAEPLVVAQDVEIARSSARLGMLSRPAETLTLGALVDRARETFRITPRVWGRPDTEIERVVTATGSASSLIPDVIASGATAMVAGEVRYHDALSAMEAGLAIVELGHDVSEWPLVGLLEETILAIGNVDPSTVHVMPATVGWWTP